MRTVVLPSLATRDGLWSSGELTRLALAWKGALRHVRRSGPFAMVLANQPEAVALFFALSTGDAPVIVLPPELRGWRSSPPLPSGTHVVLTPAQRARRARDAATRARR